MALQFFTVSSSTGATTLVGSFTNPVPAHSTICIIAIANSFVAITPMTSSDDLNGPGTPYTTAIEQPDGGGAAMTLLYLENSLAGSPNISVTIPNPSFFSDYAVFGILLPPTAGLRIGGVGDAHAFSGLNASLALNGIVLGDYCVAGVFGSEGVDAATAGNFGTNPATPDGGLAIISALSQDGLSSGINITATMTAGTTGVGWDMVAAVFIPGAAGVDALFFGTDF